MGNGQNACHGCLESLEEGCHVDATLRVLVLNALPALTPATPGKRRNIAMVTACGEAINACRSLQRTTACGAADILQTHARSAHTISQVAKRYGARGTASGLRAVV